MPGLGMKKKPSFLTLYDFLTIAGPGIVVLLINLWLQFVEIETSAKRWEWLMLVVGLAFIAIWARVVQLKRRRLSEFTWYPTWGVMAHPGEGYVLPPQEEMDRSVRETVNRWSLYYGSKASAAVMSDVVWVFFKRGLDESTANRAKMKVNGLTFARSHTMQVDFDTPSDPLEKTAFEHELGHIIMGHATGDWDQQKHHDFSRGHGLR